MSRQLNSHTVEVLTVVLLLCKTYSVLPQCLSEQNSMEDSPSLRRQMIGSHCFAKTSGLHAVLMVAIYWVKRTGSE
jgi:hypothetical protein